MIEKRNPAIAEMVEHAMAVDEVSARGVPLRTVQSSFRFGPPRVRVETHVARSSQGAKRPPENLSKEPGAWQHGWQYWSSSVSDTHFRKILMLSGQTAANWAHLRSHSGRNAGVALAHAPTAWEYTIHPHLFRVLLLECMRLPLPITEAWCSGCHALLDARGLHRAARTRSGRIRTRATPIERTLARVFREAGARVRFGTFLCDMTVGVRADDDRRIEVLSQDLPCFGGSQLAVDVALRSALETTW